MRYGLLLLVIINLACGAQSTDNKLDATKPEVNEREFTAAPAPEWSDLFLRKSGWLGGDGIFAISLSGQDSQKEDSVLFLFSDTMVGEIEGNKLKPGLTLVNNSVALLNGKTPDSTKIDFKIAGEKDAYRAIFAPKSGRPNKNTYFWLGDGFVNPDTAMDLFIFAYRITNTHDNSAFPFKETGNVLIRIPTGNRFPYADYQQLELPFNQYETGEETISFGAAVFNNSEAAGETKPDGFLYVYGTKGVTKKLVLARVKPSQITSFEKWEFWDGNDWSGDVKSVVALSDSVSNEMSVSLLSPGKYALVYQLGSIFPEICMQVGPTPVGPFGPRIVLYKTSADIQDPDLFTYNAKAHPALSEPGELLISYNVNSFSFFDVVQKKPTLYRPRFVRVKFSQNTKE
jgi:hypothetical protein